MKSLLRLQAVLALRMAMNPVVVLSAIVLSVIFAFAWLESMATDRGRGGPFVLESLLGIPFLAAGMVATLDDLDALRWSAPLRAGQVLRAHLLFWTAICAVPAAGIAWLHSADGSGAAILFLDLVLLGAAASAATPVFQRLLNRRSPGTIALAAGLVAGTATAAGTGVFLAWMGAGWAGAAILGLVFCIALAAGAWSFLRDELPPTAVRIVPATDASATGNVRTPSKARSPAWSLIRAAYPPVWTAALVGVGIPYTFLPGAPDWISVVMIAVTAQNLGDMTLRSWNSWAATPIDRGRAFRILFLPIVLFAGAGAATRLLVLEVRGDRTVFFRELHSGSREHGDPRPLVYGNLLDRDPVERFYLRAEVPFMAARVREHLVARYGLDVSQDQIETSILSGWPAGGPRDLSHEQDAVFDAMRRLQVDLAPETAAADRLRSAVDASATILFTLLFLRIAFTGIRRSRTLTLCLVVPFFVAMSLLLLSPDEAIGAAVSALRLSYYSAFQATPAPVPLLLFIAEAVAAVFLWRSGARAFRRLDVADLPPLLSKAEWGRRA